MQFHFAGCVLDLDRRELWRGDKLISVGPKVFDLLIYLVQYRSRVVTKDELLEAVWDGRVVSESTLTSQMNAARKAIGDSGDAQNLIRTIARKGFRFVGKVTEILPDKEARATHPHLKAGESWPALPDKPSIAVLPFANLNGDPEQEYFADGMVEDIITALSRIRGLFVIARNSSFAYKGRAVDVRRVGNELGVRYVLQGSVRRSSERVRIAGQLIDASSGVHLWADRFDGTFNNIFELQDLVAESVVGAIAPRLEQAEMDRSKHKPTESLDAYDFFLRGMAAFYLRTNGANDEALRLFRKAIDHDPEFASAHSMAAWCYVWRKINGWMTDREGEIDVAVQLARRAVALGKDDAVVLARSGHALGFLVGDFECGIGYMDRALLLNPNSAVAWYLSGWLRAYHGEPDVAIEHLTRAMRLSPLSTLQYQMEVGVAFAHFLAGRFGDALEWVRRAHLDSPESLPAVGIIAAVHAIEGRTEEARQATQRLLRVCPELRVSNLREWWPIRRDDHLSSYAQALRRAGLPE